MHEIQMPMHTAPGAGAVSRWGGRTWTRWRRGREAVRTRLALSELSDDTLRDIGLRRSEIPDVAGHSRFTSRI